MPDQDNTNSIPTPPNVPENNTDNSGIISVVATKISEAHNILVALSSNPSVDEMAAAIGLALYLDRLGKRITAIYSGATPNALKFLKPEETFEKEADILQDFVIALNKEKADHLRYKLDGEYVKIFITPYRSKITNDDLEFSYGDYNVDLVLALDVANGVDLDDALREHGRIMHDASVVNITTGKPGKLGEIEWSDKTASSVSEMIVELLIGMKGPNLEKEEATAFLTGIVAATDRFASAGTTSKTMKIASRLMEFGANQQLISKNITPDIENEMFSFDGATETVDQDATKLDIQHGNEANVDENKEVDADVAEKDSTLLDDLKAAEASLAAAAAEVTPEEGNEPVRIENEVDAPSTSEPTPAPESAPISEPASTTGSTITPDSTTPLEMATPISEPTPTPESPLVPEPSTTLPENPVASEAGENNKYGQMLEEALEGTDNEPIGAIASTPDGSAPFANPALSSTPEVASTPEINGVPEINYMPMPDEGILPPPPTPPIDFTAATPEATAPEVATPAPTPETIQTTPLGPQPAMQDQIYQPQVANPDSFQIPGVTP